MDLETIDDAVAAAVYRRLVAHLRHRSDAENIDLMGLAGFCRNCLGDWTAAESGRTRSISEAGRAAVYGMPYAAVEGGPGRPRPRPSRSRGWPRA